MGNGQHDWIIAVGLSADLPSSCSLRHVLIGFH